MQCAQFGEIQSRCVGTCCRLCKNCCHPGHCGKHSSIVTQMTSTFIWLLSQHAELSTMNKSHCLIGKIEIAQRLHIFENSRRKLMSTCWNQSTVLICAVPHSRVSRPNSVRQYTCLYKGSWPYRQVNTTSISTRCYKWSFSSDLQAL